MQNIIGEKNYRLLFLEEIPEYRPSINLLSDVILTNCGKFSSRCDRQGKSYDMCDANCEFITNAYINNNYFRNKNFKYFPNITHLTVNIKKNCYEQMKTIFELNKLKYLRICYFYSDNSLNNILRQLPNISVLIIESGPDLTIIDYLNNLPNTLEKIIFLISNNKDNEFITKLNQKIKTPLNCKKYILMAKNCSLYEKLNYVLVDEIII